MSFRLGKIAGVEVGVNWSVLVIFALIASGLAAGRFPTAYPDEADWAYALAGVGAAIIFFAGLLAHEVSHAIVAKRNGLGVESITLWLFGGVARLHGEPGSPGADLRIAGVGPLVSLILAVIFGAVAAGIGTIDGTDLLFGTFAWLSGINLLLAIFNALPAAPLDGGRLLRAALWRWRGDRVWAAVTAARAGRVLGAILIAVGAWTFLFTGAGWSGLWLALIGWFLLGAAAAEEQQARVGNALSDFSVGDVMSPNPYGAPGDITVQDFVDTYLFRHRFSTFPLMDDGRPTGLVTLRRIKGVPPDRRATTLLRDIACPMDQIPVAKRDDDLADLLPRMSGCSDGRALVMENGTLVGLVSPTDVMRTLERADVARRTAA